MTLEEIKQKRANDRKVFGRHLESMRDKDTQKLVSFFSKVGPVKMKKVFRNLSMGERRLVRVNMCRKLGQESKYLPFGKYFGDIKSIKQFVKNRHSVAGGLGKVKGTKMFVGTMNEYSDHDKNLSLERTDKQ
jgi:hypothetical protein